MNHDDLSDDLQPVVLREELLTEMGMPTLSVHVDFNELFFDKGDEAFDLIGKLKDLLA